MMHKTQISVLVHVLIAFSYILTEGKLIMPTFNAEVINRNHTALKFKCRVFKSPFDHKLHFLVNRRSVNVMHFINSKCYNKSRECTAETCDCSYKDFSFTWYYPVSASSISSTFGVVMHIATGNYEEVIKIQISGLYDKSFFKVDETFLDVVIPASDEKCKEIRIDDCENLNLEWVYATITIGCVCFVSLCTNLVCLRYNHKKKRNFIELTLHGPDSQYLKEYTQGSSKDTEIISAYDETKLQKFI